MNYRINDLFKVDLEKDCGFRVTQNELIEMAIKTNEMLCTLPNSVYRALDYKSISTIVGAIYCRMCEDHLDCIVNPIEKGHPDILPKEAIKYIKDEKKLKNYGVGLEIKCTIGNVKSGHKKNSQRIDELSSVVWQAHHREVDRLLAFIIDFVPREDLSDLYPMITGIFYSSDLVEDDWGKISGTNGRNTKVSAMMTSGKEKLGANWLCIIDDDKYIDTYKRILKIKN